MKNTSEIKKEKIIKSSVKVISKKGFSKAAISEIAKGAGLASSAIYQFYKNKEEILFHIIERFMQMAYDNLEDHLQGIQGAENKLRKAVWFHCRAYAADKNTGNIVLEARSYPQFYNSQAYVMQKKYAGLFTDIIEEGIKDESFRELKSPMLLRDLIFGTVDHIAINRILENEANSLEQSEKLFETIMRAIHPVQEGKKLLNKKAEKRKRIIDSATNLFAVKGFNDTSMLEIAKKAEVGEGTVYDYFGNKEKLLLSIPSEKLTHLYNTIIGNSPELKIKSIISTIFEFYSTEKEYSTILVLMLRANKKFQGSKSKQIIDDLFEIIKEEITNGQQKKIFRQKIDINLYKNLLFGTLEHIMIPMIIFNRPYDLKELGDEFSRLLIDSIKA